MKVELETYARQTGERIVKPFLLAIARDTTYAAQLMQLIKSGAFFEGRYADKVIQVDLSSKLDFGQKFAGSPSARDVEHGIFLHDLVSVFEHEPHAAEVSKGCPTTFEV